MIRIVINNTLTLICVGMMFFAAPVHACLWDSDTLDMEASQMPDIREVITGDFVRYPSLYYLMRLERVTEQLNRGPQLALFDDAAVACDRLGRMDEAIQWMQKKKAFLDTLPENHPQKKEHTYRYLANIGTHHIHRWLKHGQSSSDMEDVDLAIQYLEQAIKLNPDAHFGREKYQLKAIKWVKSLQDKHYRDIKSHAEGSKTHIFLTEELKRASNEEKDEIITALKGIIVLGAAWESYDIYYALHQALISRDHHHLGYMAELRMEEILNKGGRSLLLITLPADQRDMKKLHHVLRLRIRGGIQAVTMKNYCKIYLEERNMADARYTQFTMYMLRKLEKNQHPDTHPDFYDDEKGRVFKKIYGVSSKLNAQPPQSDTHYSGLYKPAYLEYTSMIALKQTL